MSEDRRQNPLANQAGKEKNHNRLYTLPYDDSEKIKVCQTMFVNTLGISRSVVNTVMNKLKNGEVDLIDKRGKNEKTAKKIPLTTTENVIEYINSFIRVESHNSRKDSNREYLEEDLSITAMYRLYKEWAQENGKTVASQV
ncbi:hypothetical protein TKK_0003162 [Trichogramma kaykai]|uniref:Uncharacterized protein n=1 Tax=Trichogramma kaykai TaxID=54128 RepID=A0ABD2WSD4_9HYME